MCRICVSIVTILTEVKIELKFRIVRQVFQKQCSLPLHRNGALDSRSGSPGSGLAGVIVLCSRAKHFTSEGLSSPRGINEYWQIIAAA